MVNFVVSFSKGPKAVRQAMICTILKQDTIITSSNIITGLRVHSTEGKWFGVDVEGPEVVHQEP